jgi:hypothetical protein
MKLAMTTVGSKGPAHEIENKERLSAGIVALSKAKSLGSDVLVLPGGFLLAQSSVMRRDLADHLIEKAKSLNMAVIFGIDDTSDTEAYGYAWSPNESHCWDQRSTTRNDQWDVPQWRCDELRILKLYEGAIGVLICGELFNERIRSTFLREPKPKAIVNLIHMGHGFRSMDAMKKYCENGIAVACSAHVKTKNGLKRFCVPGRGFESIRKNNDVVEGPIRIEIALFEIS